MDKLIEILINFNLPTVVSVIAALWFFTRDIKKDIKKDIEKTNAEMHQNNIEFHHMNTRVSRLEGAVYGKDVYERIKE